MNCNDVDEVRAERPGLHFLPIQSLGEWVIKFVGTLASSGEPFHSVLPCSSTYAGTKKSGSGDTETNATSVAVSPGPFLLRVASRILKRSTDDRSTAKNVGVQTET